MAAFKQDLDQEYRLGPDVYEVEVDVLLDPPDFRPVELAPTSTVRR